MGNKEKLISAILNNIIKFKDTAYHGSPFCFEKFDISKIGSGEGLAKRGRGIYLFRTKTLAPFYANLKSADAPLHLGCSPKIENPNPTVYTITGLNKLNLKKITELEAKSIKKNQELFQQQYPNIDGVELNSGEICIFPCGIPKLTIADRKPVDDFVQANKGYNFREWTTDKSRLARLGY